MTSVTAPLGPVHEAPLPSGRIRYYDQGTGLPVVLLHGVVANAALWRNVSPVISARAGVRCITVDLPLGAHGLAMPAEADLRPGALADLVVELLDHLELDQAVIVGCDTGGAIAQIVMLRHPDRVAALVLTPCDAFRNFLPWIVRYAQLAARVPGGVLLAIHALRIGWIRRLPIGLGWLVRTPLPDEVVQAYLTPARRDAGVRRDLAKVLRGISSRWTRDAAKALATFPRPVLVAWGDPGKACPLRHGRRLAEIAPRGELVVIPDAYTFVSEDQPDALCDAMTPFLLGLQVQETAVLGAGAGGR